MPNEKEIIDSMLEDKPSVTTEYVEDREQDEDNDLIDSSGDVFDPSIHDVDEDGEPKRTKLGRFRKRRIALNSRADARAECDLAAKTAAQAVFLCGMIVWAEDGKPIPEETATMEAAWTAYFHEKGVENMPAWVLILMATGQYAAPRIALPRTRTFVGKLWSSFKNLFKRKSKDDGNV